MTNSVFKGTMSAEDIYGVGSLDTLNPVSTAGATNPNDAAVTGETPANKSGIWNMSGRKFLNQPLTVWMGIIIILIALKYGVENNFVKKTTSGIGL